MALQAFNGGMYWPERYNLVYQGGIVPGSGGMTLDGSGDAIGFIFQAPATGTLDEVKFRVSTHTTGGDVEVAIQALNTAGSPDGVDIGSVATVTTSAANTTHTATMSSSVTKGTWYAVVVRWVSGNRVIQTWSGNATSWIPLTKGPVAYVRTNSGGAGWSAQNSSGSRGLGPNVSIRIDGVYNFIPGVFAASAFTNTTFNNGSATRERGISFTLPFPATIAGAFWHGCYAGDRDVILASTGGTAHLTRSLDQDYGSTQYNSTSYPGFHQIMFSDTYDAAAGENLYLTLKPTSGTNISLPDFTILDTAVDATMQMWNGGDDVLLVTRDSGGAYTVDPEKRPYEMGLIITKFDDGGLVGVASSITPMISSLSRIGY